MEEVDGVDGVCCCGYGAGGCEYDAGDCVAGVKACCCEYDDGGAIGKRYRRQDEIGTPVCVTVDYETLKDDSVTVRDRDSMEQVRIKISKLKEYLFENYFGV